MCGICGVVGFDNAISIARGMTLAMVHRGPDSDGFLDDGNLALGMRRLRIIDLNTGDQPIFNEDRSVAIVFNGEIYNFQDLYQELRKIGHIFNTSSDTEVILHAYEEWGKECLKHLRGMFALAIWDRQTHNKSLSVNHTRRLLLARDRLGIKPLYIWHDCERILFASEVRAILASSACPRQLSAAGLYTYLAFGSVQEPLTIISGIKSVPPGSWLQVELADGELDISTGTYWRSPPASDFDPTTEDVYDWLEDTVQSHLVSEVPLGSFLSGGLDSGAIVALQSQVERRNIHTFTLAFDNWPDDERDLAKKTSKRWHTNHQVKVISQSEILSDLPDAIAAMDQPTIDGINTWYVSREAKRSGLTVALSGVGGDELFAGYPSFRRVPNLKRIKKIGRWLPKSLISIGSQALFSGQPDAQNKIIALSQGQMAFDHPYFSVRGLFPLRQANELLQPKVTEMLNANCDELKTWRSAAELNIHIASQYDQVGEVSWLELSQYMRSTLLRDTDAMSMSHSLEVRVPFVDHILVDRVLPVKGRRKLNNRQPKPLLVEAVGDLLPEEVVRNQKRTFTFPFQRWLHQELSSEVRGRLNNLTDELRHLINPIATMKVMANFEERRTNWARPWALYVLDAWTRQHI